MFWLLFLYSMKVKVSWRKVSMRQVTGQLTESSMMYADLLLGFVLAKTLSCHRQSRPFSLSLGAFSKLIQVNFYDSCP